MSRYPVSFAIILIVTIGLAITVGCTHKKNNQKGESMDITSNAFQAGENIPAKYTCKGNDISPELSWSGVPEDTRSMAIVVDDPDAPGGTWVHWVVYDIPPSRQSFSENIPPEGELDDGTIQGTNDFHNIGYGGPCPPPGPAHHYHFNIYALDTLLVQKPGLTKGKLMDLMKGHVIARGELVGLFKR